MIARCALVSLSLIPWLWAQPPVPKSAAEARKMDRVGKLKAGEAAPDFNLKQLHAESRVALSGFKGQRPVALVFGSYT